MEDRKEKRLFNGYGPIQNRLDGYINNSYSSVFEIDRLYNHYSIIRKIVNIINDDVLKNGRVITTDESSYSDKEFEIQKLLSKVFTFYLLYGGCGILVLGSEIQILPPSEFKIKFHTNSGAVVTTPDKATMLVLNSNGESYYFSSGDAFLVYNFSQVIYDPNSVGGELPFEKSFVSDLESSVCDYDGNLIRMTQTLHRNNALVVQPPPFENDPETQDINTKILDELPNNIATAFSNANESNVSLLPEGTTHEIVTFDTEAIKSTNELFEKQLSFMSSIPMARLFGRALSSGLGDTGIEENKRYYEVLKRYQSILEPCLKFLDDIIYGKDIIEYKWNDLGTKTEADKLADVEKQLDIITKFEDLIKTTVSEDDKAKLQELQSKMISNIGDTYEN